MLVRPWFRIRYIGREHIPKGAFVLASNHVSYFDPLCLGFGFWCTLHFMAKSELFECHGKFVGWFLRSCGVFPVRRNTVDTDSISYAADLLKHGKAIAVFPQGGIVKEQGFTPKAGAAMLSARCKVPLLPVSICRKNGFRLFRKITVRIGEPLFPEDETLKSARQMNKALKQTIQAFLEEGHED